MPFALDRGPFCNMNEVLTIFYCLNCKISTYVNKQFQPQAVVLEGGH